MTPPSNNAEPVSAERTGSATVQPHEIVNRLEAIKPFAEAITVFLYAVRDASQIAADSHIPRQENDDGFKWRLAQGFLDTYINS